MSKNKGFTAVEMMFVLAIGAAIILMSFMAIHSAEKSKRDAQRKADLAKLEQGMIDWANEHEGIYPTLFDASHNPTADNATWQASYKQTAPEGTPYILHDGPVDTACPTPNGASNVYYERVSDRSYKIKMCLESGEVTEENSL